MRSVGIVGFSPLTYHFVHDSNCDEYWSLNHALMLLQDLPPISRMFELHKRDWYLRGETGKGEMYCDWLKKNHPFPIYMQKEECDKDLVPSCVPYPLDEICEALLPKLVKKIGKDEVKLRYFTSSGAFMFALAIYEGFDQVELYGVDMDSDTEYGYQKPCGEFWLGLALGRGIKVIITEPCTLCTAPLYGYDVVPYVDKLNVIAILKQYNVERDRYKEQMIDARDLLNTNPEDEKGIEAFLESSKWYHLYDGAITAGERVMQEDDSYVSRQYLDFGRKEYLDALEKYKAMNNTIKGRIDRVGREEIDNEAWKIYLNSRASMFANDGALQLHEKLLKLIDFKKVDFTLEMDILE